MGTIFTVNKLNKVEFQMDNFGVEMRLLMTENQFETEKTFRITHSELNRIISCMQTLNEQLNVYDMMQVIEVEEGLKIIEMEFGDEQMNHTWMVEYTFMNEYFEIRA